MRRKVTLQGACLTRQPGGGREKSGILGRTPLRTSAFSRAYSRIYRYIPAASIIEPQDKKNYLMYSYSLQNPEHHFKVLKLTNVDPCITNTKITKHIHFCRRKLGHCRGSSITQRPFSGFFQAQLSQWTLKKFYGNRMYFPFITSAL